MARRGTHANTRDGLRPLKSDEEIVYGGAGFHIVKKRTKKRKGKGSRDN